MATHNMCYDKDIPFGFMFGPNWDEDCGENGCEQPCNCRNEAIKNLTPNFLPTENIDLARDMDRADLMRRALRR